MIDAALRYGYHGCRPGGSLAALLYKHRGKRPIVQVPQTPLTVSGILAWADAFHQRTGRWPMGTSGLVADGQTDTWDRVDRALRLGERGLPAGDSLPRLLARVHGVRHTVLRPPLTSPQILAWADEYHARNGRWPSRGSGKVAGAAEEDWALIDGALHQGRRGLPGNSSLAKLLIRHRGHQDRFDLPPLTAAQILAWADAHHQRTGQRPTVSSGEVPEAPEETWARIDGALRTGSRGLRERNSLTRFLVKYGRLPYTELPSARVPGPPLTNEQILGWADEFHRRHGHWPSLGSGQIPGTTDTWRSVDSALRIGSRGLLDCTSVARLLEKERGVVPVNRQPRLTPRDILAWADAYHERTGRWPMDKSGVIPEDPGRHNWRAIDAALREGLRGMPGGDSIKRLLVRNHRVPPTKPLTVARILSWADQFHRRTGCWPKVASGPIEGQHDTWWSVDGALRQGNRSLPGGSSLALLLEKERNAVHRRHRPQLTTRRVLNWADAHYRRKKEWPTVKSGSIPEAPGETWLGVDNCLRKGLRGAPGKDTLLQFLFRNGRVPAEDSRIKRLGTMRLVALANRRPI
jgi:hypothetical protein